MFTLYPEISPFAIWTSCSFTHALRTFLSVCVARATPCSKSVLEAPVRGRGDLDDACNGHVHLLCGNMPRGLRIVADWVPVCKTDDTHGHPNSTGTVCQFSRSVAAGSARVARCAGT